MGEAVLCKGKRMSFADSCSAAGFLRPHRPLEEGQRGIGRLATSGLPLRAAATLADHSHRADNRAASSSRTFLVRFSEGGAVECSEVSLDRPGQGRAMDVGSAQQQRIIWVNVAFLDAAAGSA